MAFIKCQYTDDYLLTKNYRNEGGYMTQKQGRKNKLPDLFEPLQQDLSSSGYVENIETVDFSNTENFRQIY